jgi:hypothetical protein
MVILRNPSLRAIPGESRRFGRSSLARILANHQNNLRWRSPLPQGTSYDGKYIQLLQEISYGHNMAGSCNLSA